VWCKLNDERLVVVVVAHCHVLQLIKNLNHCSNNLGKICLQHSREKKEFKKNQAPYLACNHENYKLLINKIRKIKPLTFA
jgi:hypothetical protein